MANRAVSKRRARRFMSEVVRRIARAAPLQGLLRRAVRRFVPRRWRTWMREEPQTPAGPQAPQGAQAPEGGPPPRESQGAQGGPPPRESQEAQAPQGGPPPRESQEALGGPPPRESQEAQAPQGAQGSPASQEAQAPQGAQAPRAPEAPPSHTAPWQADERTFRRTAEAEAGGISSQESAERYARGENPGGTHQKAARRPSEQMPHPRPSFEEPQDRVERAPRGEKHMPSSRRG